MSSSPSLGRGAPLTPYLAGKSSSPLVNGMRGLSAGPGQQPGSPQSNQKQHGSFAHGTQGGARPGTAPVHHTRWVRYALCRCAQVNWLCCVPSCCDLCTSTASPLDAGCPVRNPCHQARQLLLRMGSQGLPGLQAFQHQEHRGSSPTAPLPATQAAPSEQMALLLVQLRRLPSVPLPLRPPVYPTSSNSRVQLKRQSS